MDLVVGIDRLTLQRIAALRLHLLAFWVALHRLEDGADPALHRDFELVVGIGRQTLQRIAVRRLVKGGKFLRGVHWICPLTVALETEYC